MYKCKDYKIITDGSDNEWDGYVFVGLFKPSVLFYIFMYVLVLLLFKIQIKYLLLEMDMMLLELD